MKNRPNMLSIYEREGDSTLKWYEMDFRKHAIRIPKSFLNVKKDLFLAAISSFPGNYAAEFKVGPLQLQSEYGIDWASIEGIELLTNQRGTGSIKISSFVKVEDPEIYKIRPDILEPEIGTNWKHVEAIVIFSTVGVFGLLMVICMCWCMVVRCKKALKESEEKNARSMRNNRIIGIILF